MSSSKLTLETTTPTMISTLKVTTLIVLFAYIGNNLHLAIEAAQLSVGIEHDMSKPTFGFQGPTSSQVTYDDKSGLNMKGTINDILGPPIKIAHGFGNMMAGSNMAGLGTGLKTGGAVLGFDAKLLEAAGLGHLLKGGLLMGGAVAKTGAATAVAGLPGKKIASIIEVPVKVVAMKDLAAGKVFTGLGKMKEYEAIQAKQKGATMIRDGEALKHQGMNEVLQGASEGMQNIGNMVQQTAGNAATAFKLLPIMLDMPQQQQQEQQQQQQQIEQQQQQVDPVAPTNLFGSPLGGGLFGGMGNLFGPHHNGGHGYAAVLNSTSPFTNMLMNPNLSMNHLLMPISGGPLGQSLFNKPSLASGPLFNQATSDGRNQQQQAPQSTTYNLFPGLLPSFKVSESSSSSYNSPKFGTIEQQPQQPTKINQQVEQQQQLPTQQIQTPESVAPKV